MLNHAIAPFAREEMTGKNYDICVDESTYHNKVRLEFWVVFFGSDTERKVRYLATKEMDVNFDVKDFYKKLIR